ncbi:hypothetical protein BJV78DRAFT_1238567 [Lactifluus subvellereus]|nr:hypothetical protein BJV78DRAFT_1238567 [Lactifluus subvellereus]
MQDHLTLALIGGLVVRVGAKFLFRIGEMRGREAWRRCSVVLCPAVITRFPRAVHLAAEMCTWLVGLLPRALFRVSQSSEGLGFRWFDGKSSIPTVTTALGRGGVAARDAYVGLVLVLVLFVCVPGLLVCWGAGLEGGAHCFGQSGECVLDCKDLLTEIVCEWGLRSGGSCGWALVERVSIL